MDLEELLEGVRTGAVSPKEAEKELRDLPFESLGFANVDHHRELRQGFPETIFCPGKEPGQVAEIARRLAQAGENVLATRASEADWEAVRSVLPDAGFRRRARIIERRVKTPVPLGRVAVVTAGTADIPVAEEAAVTAENCGCEPVRVFDVGVAGIHRLFAKLDVIRSARCVIAVAGMEGALASVLGGLIAQPLIAVPTSVGYGASFGGLSALLTMLNSCSAGVAVVNIDNGYGAAMLAAKILRAAESAAR